jgi:hypothetical protein
MQRLLCLIGGCASLQLNHLIQLSLPLRPSFRLCKQDVDLLESKACRLRTVDPDIHHGKEATDQRSDEDDGTDGHDACPTAQDNHDWLCPLTVCVAQGSVRGHLLRRNVLCLPMDRCLQLLEPVVECACFWCIGAAVRDSSDSFFAWYDV